MLGRGYKTKIRAKSFEHKILNAHKNKKYKINQFFFSCLVVARCYLWLFLLYINTKTGKIVVKC